MLRHEMVTEIQSLIEDPAYWAADRLTTLLNRGMRDIARTFGIVVSAHHIFLSVAGQQQYMLPQDFVANETLWFDSGDNQIIHILPRPQSIYGLVTDPTEEGTPTKGFFWAKEDREELWIHPTFATAGIEINWFYWRRPPNLVLDNDEPLLPRDWHTHLVDYATRWTWAQDQERGWSLASQDVWWKMMKNDIQVSDVIAEMASRDIRVGQFDDQLPRGAGSTLGVRMGNDGDVIW